MAETNPRALILGAIEGFDGTPGAIERLIEPCADAVVLDMAPTDESPEWQRIEGKQALHDFLCFAYGLGRELRQEVTDCVADDESVAVFTTTYSTLNVDLHGFVAGSRQKADAVNLYRVRDGQVVSVKTFHGPHVLVEGAEPG